MLDGCSLALGIGKVSRTSLGEEGAESLIGISLLALLGQISIGLDDKQVSEVLLGRRYLIVYLNAMLETVELPKLLVFISCDYHDPDHRSGFRLCDSAITRSTDDVGEDGNVPPSKNWRSGNPPGRL